MYKNYLGSQHLRYKKSIKYTKSTIYYYTCTFFPKQPSSYTRPPSNTLDPICTWDATDTRDHHSGTYSPTICNYAITLDYNNSIKQTNPYNKLE